MGANVETPNEVRIFFVVVVVVVIVVVVVLNYY